MDSTKIFIDTDTEIAFIIEKVNNSRTQKVCLVVPDRASVLTSIVGLKLIKQVIDKTNKLLVLVTLDELGGELARKAGLVVVARIGEINDRLWEEVQKEKFAFKKKSSRSHYYVDDNKEDIEPEETNKSDQEQTEPGEELEVEEPEDIEEAKEEVPIKEVPTIRINLKVDEPSGIEASKEEVHEGLSSYNVKELNLDEEENIDRPKQKDKGPKKENANSDLKPQVRERKKTPTDSGLSNLSFSVGKDISEEKKK